MSNSHSAQKTGAFDAPKTFLACGMARGKANHSANLLVKGPTGQIVKKLDASHYCTRRASGLCIEK